MGVRLPGQSTTRFCFGDSDGRLSECAWFNGNSGGRMHAVGGRRPNAWGLYDMHGNIWSGVPTGTGTTAAQ